MRDAAFVYTRKFFCHALRYDIKLSVLFWWDMWLPGCSLYPEIPSIKMGFGTFAPTWFCTCVPRLAYKQKAQGYINVIICRQVYFSSIWQSWHVPVVLCVPRDERQLLRHCCKAFSLSPQQQAHCFSSIITFAKRSTFTPVTISQQYVTCNPAIMRLIFVSTELGLPL